MKKGTYEDQIRIEELEVYAHHGVYPEENEKGQHFYVNATLYTNTHPAGLADDLSLSTNYGEVCQFITEFMHPFCTPNMVVTSVPSTLSVTGRSSVSPITDLRLHPKSNG